MDLDRKIEANDQGFFVVTFLNKREQNLTEATLKYVFSKFGQLADIKYSEHGRVFISYKEKEGAFKALEVMNMGTKYHVETDWQPVKKNETVQSTKSKEEDLFIYLRIPPMVKIERIFFYIKCTLICYEERFKIKDAVTSWIIDGYVKIVFDSKMSKDEIMKRHQENPFKWTKGFGNFEFSDDVPIAYIRCPKPNMSIQFCGYHVRKAMFGNEMDAKTKIRFVFVSKNNQMVKVIFDAKTTKDGAMEVHKRKPFEWPENLGVFEFLNISEALSMVGESADGKKGKKKED